jgi:hypothetical protein
MKQICTSVVREGGDEEDGFVACASNKVAAVTATPTAQSALSIRLKSSHIRAFLRPLAVELANIGNVEVFWRAILNPTLSAAPTFAANSTAAESSADVLTYTEGTGIELGCGYATAQGAAKSVISETVSKESALGVAADIAGTSDILSLIVQVPSTSSDVYSVLKYLELY